MRKHNRYKDILCVLLFCAVSSLLWKEFGIVLREHKPYGYRIQTEQDVTEEIVKELKKLAGICQFEPEDTVPVTLYLGNFTLQTELVGIDLEDDLLRWKAALPEITMGNTPALFFGEEVFSHFTDREGRTPSESEIKTWMDRYLDLNLSAADAHGKKRKVRICGILIEPKDKICMEKGQMEEVFFGLTQIKGGFLKIQGGQNARKARKILEDAGFSAAEVY